MRNIFNSRDKEKQITELTNILKTALEEMKLLEDENRKLTESNTNIRRFAEEVIQERVKINEKFSELKNQVSELFKALNIKGETGILPVVQICNKELVAKILRSIKE